MVSPNVKNNNKTIDQWIAAMKAEKVAFMGYAPSDVAHKRIGAKFAYEIKADDVVLIARRDRKAADLVACGVVSGGYKRVRKSFHAPTTYGSHRELSPFVPLKKAPRSVPIMEVLRHTAALRQLNSAKATHRRVCRWLDRQLSIASNLQNSNGSTKRSTNAVEASLPQHQQLEYQIRTRRQVKSAQKREAELVKDYAAWLHKKGRVIAAFKNGYLTCDLYEKAGCNLIEAKARGEREYIRMAVGQLLDYSYLGRKILRRPNLAILLPDKPPDHAVAWLRPLRIGIIWKVGNRFRDNAGGRFT